MSDLMEGPSPHRAWAERARALGTREAESASVIAPAIDFDAFEVLSFDCYGTLIDWEAGLLAALAPIFAAHGVAPDREDTLRRYGELESAIEAGEYVEYRAVLARVLQGLGERFGFSPSSGELSAFPASVRDWPPFPDSPAALRALQSRYRLAVISNVDDDLFAHSARRLGVSFDWVVTAQQVRSYKPSLGNFRRAFERIGVPPARILHVAQSRFHDIAPAKRLGLATVWVNRRRDTPGPGATPASEAVPDLEVRDLAELARRAGVRTT
jgi:2-haloacid dehalogenase